MCCKVGSAHLEGVSVTTKLDWGGLWAQCEPLLCLYSVRQLLSNTWFCMSLSLLKVSRGGGGVNSNAMHVTHNAALTFNAS